MVYFVGVMQDVRERGIVVNVGLDRRCNIFIEVNDATEWPTRVLSGDRVRVAADARWRKNDNDSYSLSFLAKKIEVK